jgi:hypothetical protein
VALTACLVAFAATLAQRRHDPDDRHAPRRWLIPGVWFGLALLSKVSALVFAPLIALAALAHQRKWNAIARDIARMTLLGLAIAFV